MKKKFLITITLLAAAGLGGCGIHSSDFLNEEKEPESREIIEFDSLFSDNSEEQTDTIQSTVQEQTKPTPETSQEPVVSQNASEADLQDKFWYDKYKAFVDDWTLVDDYGDLEYLRMYFGEDFAFNSYWLCDVDNNGTPELFLYAGGPITAVITCTEEQAVFLFYDDIYGINPETDEIVISGHWHGAGGSGDNEWSAYQILGDKAEYSMYIDYFDLSADGEPNRYIVPQTEEYKDSSDGAEYEELYAIHVEPCISVNNYTKYDLSDFSGLDNVQ